MFQATPDHRLVVLLLMQQLREMKYTYRMKDLEGTVEAFIFIIIFFLFIYLFFL